MRGPFGGGGRAGVVGDENCIPRAGRSEGVELGRRTLVKTFPKMSSQEIIGKKGSEERALVLFGGSVLFFEGSEEI